MSLFIVNDHDDKCPRVDVGILMRLSLFMCTYTSMDIWRGLVILYGRNW